MKTIKILFILSAVFFTGNVLALGEDENERCKKPKFYTFSPSAEKGAAEIAPGSEFSFHSSEWTAPGTVEVTVKKIKTAVTVENRNIFFIFKGKLPPELTDTYARISITGKAKLGCSNRGGWLVKITGDGAIANTAEETEEAKEDTDPTSSDETPKPES
jgi:hypothetical protein